MKKVVLAALLIMSVSALVTPAQATTIVYKASGSGQHIPASQVPAPVMASFTNLYPTATNVKWEKEREHGHIEYKADFYIGNQRWEARFLADGTLVRQRRK